MQIPSLGRTGGPRFACGRSTFAAVLLATVSLSAQSVAPTPASAPARDASTDAVVELSPFQVTAAKDQGYAARETLAGSRLKTELKDVPSQISVMTKEFLEDIATVSLDDAYRYSANVENTSEFQSATIGSGDFNTGVVNIFNNNRVRGLTAPGRTHDFFLTNIPGDTYNSERITFSSGPNSILFGNGNPAGIIDNSFKRASVQRTFGSVEIRADDNDSLRGSFDFNQPIWNERFAIRLAGVKADNNHWREPAGDKAERLYATFEFRPFKSTTIRGYYEDVNLRRIVARNTLVGDLVTPWIAAGRPMFNNGLTGTAANPAASDPLFQRNTLTQNVYLLGATGSDAFLAWGAAGTATGSTVRYSALSKGPGSTPYQTGTDSYTYSLLDESISPRSVSINGNGTRNYVDADVKGVIIEQRVGQNLFLEAAYNKEHLVNPVTDFIRGIESAIRVDANLYLPDRVTPNPNAGKYYIEGTGRGRVWLRDNEEFRVTGSYELDLTKRHRWLGRHRLAVLYQRVDQVAAGQEFATRVVPAGTDFNTALNNYGSGTYNTLRYRYYLSNPADPSTGTNYYFNVPFDPMQPVALPNGATAYTINNPYGGTSQELITHSLLEGKLFAMNNYLFSDRLVTSFGWREDRVRLANAQTPRLGGSTSAFQSILNTPVSKEWSTFSHGNTFTGGAVAHVLPWLSVFYNKSNTWNPPLAASHNPDNSIVEGSTGEGTDYGVMMRFFDGRLSLRIDKYKNTSGPDVSAYRTDILPQILDIEQTIYDAAQAGLIGSYPSAGSFNPQVSNNFYYEVVSNQVSQGYEFELIANPTPNWRIALNGAKSTASESNIAAPWLDFVRNRIAVWAQYPNLVGPTSEGQTEMLSNRVLSLIQTLNVINQAEGRRTEQQREWRVNLLTRYGFSSGVLKGAFVGGGYRWRSKGAIGYRATTVANAFNYPGGPAQVTVPSIESPIYSPSYGDTELFVGYSRRVHKKVNWKIQLNVRNVFDTDDLLGQRANTSGTVTVYTVQDPRSFVLTNTFEF